MVVWILWIVYLDNYLKSNADQTNTLNTTFVIMQLLSNSIELCTVDSSEFSIIFLFERYGINFEFSER